MSLKVREPAAAGRFYPGEKDELLRFLNESLFQPYHRGEPFYKSVNALIVPHAGYSFSGPTAARAFSYINPGAIERAIIIGPSHYVGFHGISIAPYDSYRTPLGDIQLDSPACDTLVCSSELFTRNEEAHRYEHSLEVELPFVQIIAPECKIIPLVTGDLSLNEVRKIANELHDYWDLNNTLLIISSDFTHYGKQFGYCPFSEQVASEGIEKLDGGAIDRILENDTNGFDDYVKKTGATICGRIPITILLALIEKSVKPAENHLIDYTSSGRILNDYTNSVSYVSILADNMLLEQPSTAHKLTKQDKKFLLELACYVIASKLNDEAVVLPDDVPHYLYDKGNVFVTLRVGNQLRGCIGSIETDDTILENVIKNAENAAFGDPRFLPLTPDEFTKISIEISCLTQPKHIRSVREIILGRHGVILENGSQRAVFLPQVAIEQGWDRDTMLENLSLKAGLGNTGWYKEGTSFSTFETISFSTNDSEHH